jgi:A/G-specific adenine glycosylase
MYEFPGVDQKMTEKEIAESLKQEGFNILQIEKLPSSRHIFSHVEWHMDAYEIRIADERIPLKKGQILAGREQLKELALPSAFRTYIDHYALREGEHL